MCVQLIREFYNQTYTARSGGEYVDEYTITFIWSLTTALFLPGGMIGAFSAGYLADKVGRSVAHPGGDFGGKSVRRG